MRKSKAVPVRYEKCLFRGCFFFVCRFFQNVFLWQTNKIDGSGNHSAYCLF